MPYKGSNAEWLNRMSMYDLLCMIQREPQMFCVIDKLKSDTIDVCKLCEKHGGNCRSCLAEWLADERK